MIKNSTKKKLIVELEKTGNIFVACARVGISRSTYYEWTREHGEFKVKAEEALNAGRESNCDVAEHCLMVKVKQKDVGAIKYLLSHDSPRFKGKETSNVVIVHKKEMPLPIGDAFAPDIDKVSIKQVIGEVRDYVNELRMNGEIPKKLNGMPIPDDEMLLYYGYIRDWQEMQEEKEDEEPMPDE